MCQNYLKSVLFAQEEATRAPMSPSGGWVKVGLEQKYTHRRQTTSWKVDEERGFGSWWLPFHSTRNTEGAER